MTSMPDITLDAADLQKFLAKDRRASDGKVRIDPDHVEQDLARLVLGLMEFIRQVMELQAIRRMDAGRLTAEEEEKLGTTLMRAEAAILDMAEKFGLQASDLSLDLGPLGKTV